MRPLNDAVPAEEVAAGGGGWIPPGVEAEGADARVRDQGQRFIALYQRFLAKEGEG